MELANCIFRASSGSIKGVVDEVTRRICGLAGELGPPPYVVGYSFSENAFEEQIRLTPDATENGRLKEEVFPLVVVGTGSTRSAIKLLRPALHESARDGKPAILRLPYRKEMGRGGTRPYPRIVASDVSPI